MEQQRSVCTRTGKNSGRLDCIDTGSDVWGFKPAVAVVSIVKDGYIDVDDVALLENGFGVWDAVADNLCRGIWVGERWDGVKVLGRG